MSDHHTLSAERIRWTNHGPGAATGEHTVTVDGAPFLFAYAANAPVTAGDKGGKRDWTIVANVIVAGDLLRFTVTRAKSLRTDVTVIATRKLADMVRERQAITA